MNRLDKLNDRTDAEKWAHPELQQAFAAAETPNPMFEQIYNPEIPFEKRKADNESAYEAIMAAAPSPDPEKNKKYDILGCPEEPDTSVSIMVAKPGKIKKKKLPCILHIAAGGLYACYNPYPDTLAEQYDAVAVVCDYRTLFKGGCYPATINDLHATYQWVVEHADELGVDSDKIVINGISSGGHLALALCHRLKRYGYHPRGCVAEVPIPDERTIYNSSKRVQNWGGRELYASGQAWLGYRNANAASVPAEAFANHAEPEDCIGLPPTFIHTCDSEVATDPDMAYASKLIRAGVYVDLHVWGGCNHAAMTFEESSLNRSEYGQFYCDLKKKQIQDCFRYDLRRQWIEEELKED